MIHFGAVRPSVSHAKSQGMKSANLQGDKSLSLLQSVTFNDHFLAILAIKKPSNPSV